MSQIEHESELLNFINGKVKSSPLDYYKVFYLYSKIIKLALIKTYNEFKSIQYSLSCVNMICNIFFIVLSYSNNSKLTMFLSERAIILYIEYINLSNDLNYYDDINILDVKLFIYKKTIGPLKLSKKKNNSELKHFTKFSNIYKDLIIEIFKTSIDSNLSYININNVIDNTFKAMGNVFFQYYTNNCIDKLNNIIIRYNNIKSLYLKINTINMYLEIYIFILTISENPDSLFNKIILNNSLLCDTTIISEIKNNKLYLDIVNDLDKK